jgi:hypothetical protein
VNDHVTAGDERACIESGPEVGCHDRGGARHIARSPMDERPDVRPAGDEPRHHAAADESVSASHHA